MKTTADIEKEAVRENLPEMPSLFQGLFGTNPRIREYLKALEAFMAAPAAHPVQNNVMGIKFAHSYQTEVG